LPEDFKRISLEHPRSRVLASVPGTQQAAEAVVLAQIPQFARVNKKEITAPEVIYQGEPQFEIIQGTQLQRAANTDKDVIKFGEMYYLCYQGVWFVANSPTGAWTLAESVPKEIYAIPPNSPSHSVTYVALQEDENANDEWITYAAYPGYTGVMGLRRLGYWLVLPALLLVRRLLPDLLPVLAHLWLWRLVQRLHRCLRDSRTNLWTIRRCRFWRALQPEHRNVRSGRLCLWTVRSARCGAGL
jgi:hypothetical protein